MSTDAGVSGKLQYRGILQHKAINYICNYQSKTQQKTTFSKTNMLEKRLISTAQHIR